MPWFYYVARALVKILLFLFTNWQVRGTENIPAEGAMIVVANHIHLADPPVLGVSLTRKLIFMAKKELFRTRISSYLIRGFGAFPVQRRRLDRTALHQADQVLAKGLALAVFPEGSRSKNAQLQSALPGTVRIALRSNVPILPVGIIGTEHIRGVAWIWRRPRIVVNIGRTFSLPSVDGRLTKAELAGLADCIMMRIAELLPSEYRGHYAGHRD